MRKICFLALMIFESLDAYRLFLKKLICTMTSQNIPTGFQKHGGRKCVQNSEYGDGERLKLLPSQTGAWKWKRCEMSALLFNIPAGRGTVIVGRSRCERKPSDASAADLRGGDAGGDALTGM